MSLGFSFAPTAAQADQAKAGRGSPQFGTQGSIKTLSYSLPKVTGAATANGLSPLVGSEQQGSGISSAVLQSVLRTVLGPDHASMLMAQAPTPQASGYHSGGGSDQGLSALLAGLGGGGGTPSGSTPSGSPDGGTPAPTIHPGSEYTPRPPVDYTADPPALDPGAQNQTSPTFGGGGWQDWRNREGALNGQPAVRQDKYGGAA